MNLDLNLKWSKIEWTKERMVWTVSAALSAAALLSYLFFYGPLFHKIKQAVRQYEKNSSVLAQARKSIEEIKQAGGPRRLLSQAEASSFIQELSRQGKEFGLNFVSVQSLAAQTHPDFGKVLPVNMEIECSYEALGRFLEILDNADQGIAQLAGLDVAPAESNPKAVRARLLMNVCMTDETRLAVPDIDAWAQALSKVPAARQVKRSEFTAWARNPFSLTNGSTGTNLNLNGILWDTAKPVAIINNQVVAVGGMVGNSRVVDIRPDKVIVNDGSKDSELHL